MLWLPGGKLIWVNNSARQKLEFYQSIKSKGQGEARNRNAIHGWLMSSEAGRIQNKMAAGCRARRSMWFRTSHLWTRRESWSSFSMERVLSKMQGWVWWLKGICKAGHLSYCTLILHISSINFLSLSIPNFIAHLYSQTAVSYCPVHIPNTTTLSLTQLSNMELENLFLTFRKEYPLGLNTQYSVMT